jgi:hypothetical protein
MQQRTHAWPISRLHSGEQTDDRERRRRQSDALSVTAMRAGGASFLCAAPHCSLGAALGCVHERWRRAHGEWGWEKKKRQLVQRSAAQRTACEVSEHDLDTAAAQAWHTGAPYQC